MEKPDGNYGLDFSTALEVLKQGEKLGRAGWWEYNYVVLVADTKGQHSNFLASAPNRVFCVWEPNTEDLLAEDWEIVVLPNDLDRFVSED
jgi:hypothetical protein